MYVLKPQENVKAKKKQKTAISFFLEECVMELDQGKNNQFIAFQIEFCTVIQNHFGNNSVSL